MQMTTRASLTLATVLCAASTAGAQTDFYNTDRGRPLRTEDAIVVEFRAFELQAAPLTFTRVARGASQWGIAPELAWGFAPRTQLEVAFPVTVQDDGVRARALTALSGVEVELLHQLNAVVVRQLLARNRLFEGWSAACKGIDLLQSRCSAKQSVINYCYSS